MNIKRVCMGVEEENMEGGKVGTGVAGRGSTTII
jgi:hypothetical protein